MNVLANKLFVMATSYLIVECGTLIFVNILLCFRFISDGKIRLMVCVIRITVIRNELE